MAEYAEPAGTGDVIGLTLEFIEGLGTLSFTKNSTEFGPAFTNIPGPVWPAVCLYYNEAQVSISCKL
jgi:hypothetical protein